MVSFIIISTALAYLLLSPSLPILTNWLHSHCYHFMESISTGVKYWPNIASQLRNLHNFLIKVWNSNLIVVDVLKSAVKAFFFPPLKTTPISLRPLVLAVSLLQRETKNGIGLIFICYCCLSKIFHKSCHDRSLSVSCELLSLNFVSCPVLMVVC